MTEMGKKRVSEQLLNIYLDYADSDQIFDALEAVNGGSLWGWNRKLNLATISIIFSRADRLRLCIPKVSKSTTERYQTHQSRRVHSISTPRQSLSESRLNEDKGAKTRIYNWSLNHASNAGKRSIATATQTRAHLNFKPSSESTLTPDASTSTPQNSLQTKASYNSADLHPYIKAQVDFQHDDYPLQQFQHEDIEMDTDNTTQTAKLIDGTAIAT